MARSDAIRTRESTELENCVLGIVAQIGPCSPYAVRQVLGASRSSYWSASAGAIYPLLDRLRTRGLLLVSERAFGTRRRRSYRLSARGRRALDRWLSDPVADDVAAFTHDPIRTRVFFLAALSPARRRVFLDDAIAKTEAALEGQRAELGSGRAAFSDWEVHGREGAIAELCARMEWLRSVREGV